MAGEVETMDITKLQEPFAPSDIEWRVQSAQNNGKPWARVLAYVTNRAIMDRLDKVCGPENWSNEFKEGPDGGVLCGLSIFVKDRWITKWDGAANTQIEGVKGGISSAMKRAGAQWGIGRYLYKLEAGYAKIHDKGQYSGQYKDKKYFKYDPPNLPDFAIPKGADPKVKGAPEREPQDHEIITETEEEYYERVQGKIMDCQTSDDLNALWYTFNRTERTTFEADFSSRKNAIMGDS